MYTNPCLQNKLLNFYYLQNRLQPQLKGLQLLKEQQLLPLVCNIFYLYNQHLINCFDLLRKKYDEPYSKKRTKLSMHL